MKYDIELRRGQKRLRLGLTVQVFYQADTGKWAEETRLLDVTRLGARFAVSRPVKSGRLLRLTMVMPKQLRRYDLDAPEYHVWALVCNVRTYTLHGAGASQSPRFEAGVAFIGKHPPASYLKDPSTHYEIAHAADNEEMWHVREITFGEEAGMVAGRASPRADGGRDESISEVAYEVSLELLDEEGEVAAREETRTKSISRHGASVHTTLEAARGRYVRLTIPRGDFMVVAIVRGQSLDAGGGPCLELEFIDGHWLPPQDAG